MVEVVWNCVMEVEVEVGVNKVWTARSARKTRYLRDSKAAPQLVSEKFNNSSGKNDNGVENYGGREIFCCTDRRETRKNFCRRDRGR